MHDATIGEAARLSGVKVTTIRFYETRGLLAEPPRSGGGQRLYGPRDIDRLRFIRHARELGFAMEATAELLRLADHPDAPCDRADHIATDRLADVRRRIAALQSLERELERMLSSGCRGAVGDCTVLESLADHGQCLGSHPVLDRPVAT